MDTPTAMAVMVATRAVMTMATPAVTAMARMIATVDMTTVIATMTIATRLRRGNSSSHCWILSDDVYPSTGVKATVATTGTGVATTGNAMMAVAMAMTTMVIATMVPTVATVTTARLSRRTDLASPLMDSRCALRRFTIICSYVNGPL